MTVREIARLIDHSLLHPALTDKEILQGCEVARKYEVATVCVKPYSIPLVKPVLKGSPVGICAVIGFPHGNSMVEVKVREALEAIQAGAHEIDMVINIGKAKSGAFDYVREEVRFVNRACQKHSAVLKVIFENDFLTNDEIIALSKEMAVVRPDFVKTSTGYGFVKRPDGNYSYKGATEEHVKLMRQYCDPATKIKAAGGIRTLDDLLKFQALGCARIGATATEAILAEAKKRGYM
jgi:deoxyribose-phosphate aldolase